MAECNGRSPINTKQVFAVNLRSGFELKSPKEWLEPIRRRAPSLSQVLPRTRKKNMKTTQKRTPQGPSRTCRPKGEGSGRKAPRPLEARTFKWPAVKANTHCNKIDGHRSFNAPPALNMGIHIASSSSRHLTKQLYRMVRIYDPVGLAYPLRPAYESRAVQCRTLPDK